MGCTQADWLRCLPEAIGAHAWQADADSVRVHLGAAATLAIRWQQAEPREMALARIPRLIVTFQFVSVDERTRLAFMTRFDLYMQRGGG